MVTATQGTQGVAARLPWPARLRAGLPLSPDGERTVRQARGEVRRILAGTSRRLIALVGPCSVHDPGAAVDYAARLAEIAARHADVLHVIMRAHVEKPRTAGGWPGLIGDPAMDGTADIGAGLEQARALLVVLAGAGMPASAEWVNPVTPDYLGDTVTLGAIGARTIESQVHRQMAAGLGSPVILKNRADGNVHAAVNAARVIRQRHVYLDAGHGHAARIADGNPHGLVTLRGGKRPNYGPAAVKGTLALLERAGLPQKVMIDASHGNSGKDPGRVPEVIEHVARQVRDGQRGIAGLSWESNIVAGRQDPGPREFLAYGQSVTDACAGLDVTAAGLAELAAAVRAGR